MLVLLQTFVILVLTSQFQCKPLIIRNISDCSITNQGILHYQGKYSTSKFEHDCLPWIHLQETYPDIINTEKFFADESIENAENFCRNPNSNVNGPWCFVQNGNLIAMETCSVCQSLAIRSTMPTDIEIEDQVTVVGINRDFFGNIQNEIRRYTLYIRERFQRLFNQMKAQFARILQMY